jgi:hypothetical protein
MKFVMPIEGRSAEQLYDLNRNGSGGFYPIGLNNSYHGGMHFEGERLPVVAIADGIIVAYRLTSEYLEERSSGKTYKYSNCFVLIKHEYKTPKGQEFTFYSHYNHLAPWNDLTTWMPENGRYPHFVVKPGYKIKKDGVKVFKKAEEKRANILSKTLKNRENVVASPVTDKKEWAKIEGTEEYFICTRGNAEKKNVVCIPELDKVVTRDIPVKAGTIIGYSGLCEAEGAPARYTAVHVEVFADDDSEDFINNVKGDGKPTLLKLAERQELKHRNKVYTDLSALPKYTRNKGTEVQIIKEEGAWVHVKDVNLAGIVEHAWLIDKYDTQKNHYTVNDAYIEQVKAQFPGVDIDGEEATDENKRTVTSATHFKYKSRQGTTSRVITVAAGSATQQYWIKKAFLINNKEIKADNCDLWSDNPDKVVVTSGGAVPYHCVVPSKEQITEDNVIWHRVEIGEIGGWVKEPEVVKVSPYDWLKCNFGVIKEQKDEGFSLFSSGSENDSQIDYKKLPAFFQQIFDRIDSNHDKIISDQELRNIMRDPRWAHFLSHMICYHQTEWCAEAHGEEVERVKRQLGQDAAERLKARIRQMCWWDSVSERPGSKQLYHWGPVAFVEQMKFISSFAALTTDERKRVMTIISKFEGHYWSCNKDTEFYMSTATVNYAGVVHIGLSWGFIQFTQDGGMLGKVLKTMAERDQDQFANVFGNNWRKVVEVTTASGFPGQTQYQNAGAAGRAEMRANGTQIFGPRLKKVATEIGATEKHLWEPPWVQRFDAAGRLDVFQKVQDEIAISDYLEPALRICKQRNVQTAKGVAVAFDRCVNQGVVGTEKLFKKFLGDRPLASAEEEMSFLGQVRDNWAVGHFIHERLKAILLSAELGDTVYDVETY